MFLYYVPVLQVHRSSHSAGPWYRGWRKRISSGPSECWTCGLETWNQWNRLGASLLAQEIYWVDIFENSFFLITRNGGTNLSSVFLFCFVFAENEISQPSNTTTNLFFKLNFTSSKMLNIFLCFYFLFLKGFQTLYFTEEPKSIRFSNTETKEIHCKANGRQKPKISWLNKNGGLVKNVTDIRSITQDGRLVFHPFDASSYNQDIHFNVYQCKAENNVGVLLSAPVLIQASKIIYSNLFIVIIYIHN